VAAWEHRGFLFPLLENGEHMAAKLSQSEMEKGNYFIFIGAKPKNPAMIIGILRKYTQLGNQVSSIEYIEGRRFNLNLRNNRVIMLPENDTEAAIKQIRESGILSKTFTRLDLRNPGRMLVTR
jgi:cell division septal protein FtsQ